MEFRLRFHRKQIQRLAKRYSYEGGDGLPVKLGAAVRQRGFMTVHEFLQLCRWKTQRSKSKCERNSPEFVREATRIALATSTEELRIGTLTLLSGVSWPTASVILHFCHKDPYPIVDFRAWWSLGIHEPKVQTCRFDQWWAYTEYCRDLTTQASVSMRTLDRALWQYSRENRRPV